MTYSITAKSRVRLTWPAQHQVPPGGYYHLFHRVSGGSWDWGVASRINVDPIEAWPQGRHPGFGYGPFGQRAFGYPAFGAPFGYGPFGSGPFGFGTFSLEYITDWYDDGDHEFAAIGYDKAGNAVTPATAVGTVTLAGEPIPPSDLSADSYDSGTDTLALSWALSPDDQDA